MNKTLMTMRLDEEQRTAELEIMAPTHRTDVVDINEALKRVGMRSWRTIEFSTPKFRVSLIRLAEFDSSRIDPARILQVLREAQGSSQPSLTPCCRAA